MQGLWDSWEKDAWASRRRWQAVRRHGQDPAGQPAGQARRLRGPRPPIPPSEQGQPVIFQAGGGGYGLELAGRYAGGVYANPYTIEDARAQRQALRDATKRAGRDPDEVVDLCQRVRYLGAMIGLPLGPGRLDEPLTADQLADAMPSPHDPRSARALAVAREDWTMRDVLAHGVIDFHPVTVVSAADVADHMQQWFEAEACDGFSIAATATMTASTPSSTRSSRSCRNAAWSTTTTKAPHCARTSAPTSSTASTRASRSRPPS
ncbi:LLM class flavin-dependent oxidoreductase [Streptomyces sp. HP-A2021]|uniref:LLM class flavin-dependent oxidoreductase n=1 Tax=Streptomyces sp. HP-A2021 TaxID=2927875 RepID=UPI001FAF88A4|nr:LLM class flavin-dependent oxidoreductase [Streptomyces sp. HP-A2021]UOB07679.1 LLM class flavin-dependent oxidoreductase [Streptomyces sp. HP-A2021]